MKIAYISTLLSLSLSAQAHVDCSAVYKNTAAQCEVVACDSKFQTFLGKWSGPFSAYSEELSTNSTPVFRPFLNEVTYSPKDCLKNIENGDVFIIGRRTDSYPEFQGLPAKKVSGLLITGKKADGSPFLKTIEDHETNTYRLDYQNKLANLSVWSVKISEDKTKNQYEMRFTTVDAQDFTETSVHKRNVTITMSIGPVDKPIWEGVISSGFHVRQETQGF